jgi:hypothetical protein
LRLSAAASVNHASQKGGNLNYVFGQESKEGRRVQPPLPMKGVFLINNSAFSQQNFAKMSQKKSTLFEVSEVKLTYRNKVKLANSPQIRSSADAHEVLSQNWSDDLELVESFNVLFLNRANKVKGMFQVSKGGVAGKTEKKNDHGPECRNLKDELKKLGGARMSYADPEEVCRSNTSPPRA